MTCKLRMTLAIVALSIGCGNASASLNATDEATLAQHVLTENELNRLAAVMADASVHGQGASINMAGTESLESIAAQVDAQPGAHALLASHGFTAKEYVVTVLSTLRVAMNARTGRTTSAPNAAFYRAHQAQIDRMMSLGPSPASATDRSADVSSLDASKLGECTKVAMGSAALVPLSMRGTANTPAESREKTAKVLADFSSKVSEPNLKDDFRDLSEEIRRQAAAPQFTSTPRFAHGVDDLTNWLHSNCSEQALRK
jgi:uncharacterized protein YdbL (DUF1318 family)